MKAALLNFGLLLFAVTHISCNNKSVVGEWVEAVPGMEEMVQGFKLEKGGKAASINMATLLYESWEQQGDELILTGKSVGNHITLTFTDTLMIAKEDDVPALRSKDGTRTYTRNK